MDALSQFNGVHVELHKDTLSPTPYGLTYEAKGAYVQEKYIIVVGNIQKNTTTRLKYRKEEVKYLTFY
jgi:hypothetical protein